MKAPIASSRQIWLGATKEVSKMTDTLGKPVDSLIRPTVIALRVLGFRTTGSCQGHLSHGLKAPWVDIGTPPFALLRAIKVAKKGSAEGEKLNSELKWLVDENLHMQERLVGHLDGFYRVRSTPVARRLILVPEPYGAVRLTNQGAEIQAMRSFRVARRELLLYREEIVEFAECLAGEFSRTSLRDLVVPARNRKALKCTVIERSVDKACATFRSAESPGGRRE